MILRQFFVGQPWRRQAFGWSCLVSALALATAGCGDNTAKAYREAATAQALLNQGDVDGARRAMAKALALRDDQLDILLLDARIKSRAGDVRAAYDAYRTVLAMDPRQPEALLAVAQLGLVVGETRQSREAVDTVLSIMPGQPDALLLKGIHALNRKDYTGAMAVADELLANDASDRGGIVLKARVLTLTDRRAEAFAMLRKAAETIGNDEMIATALLENARVEGNVSVMLEQFPLLLQARPQSIALAIDEANVRYKSGDVAGARAVGARILDRFGDDTVSLERLRTLWREYDPDPLDPEARRRLAESGALNARLTAARFYLAQGKPDVAEALIGNARDARAMGLRARIAVATDQPGAITAAASVIAQDTTNCDALAAAAEWNLRQGKPKAAVGPAQNASTECGDTSDGYLLLARAYSEQDRAAGATRVYREGLAAHPDDYPLSEAYTQWLLSTGRRDAAKVIADRLTDRAPQRPSSWRLLAATCQAVGDSACAAAAREGLEKAKKDLSVDLPPGQRISNPLFGQQWR
jgi:tetratricopeptide (TPR) repeat protein